MHIAIDARSLSLPEKALRGTGHFVRLLLSELAHLDRENHYSILLAPGQELAIPGPNFEPVLLPWEYGDISRASWWTESWRAGAVLRRLAPDIYHSADLYLPRGFPGPILVTAYDYFHLPLAGPITLFQKRYGWRWNLRFRTRYRWTWWALARSAARVATISRTTAGTIASHWPNLKARLVPITLGIENDAFLNAPSPSFPVEASRLGRPLILHVGGLENRKNPDGVLGTFERLRRESPGATLLLVGPAHGARPEQPGVVLAGYLPRDQVLAAYGLADLLLYPSFDEGFGLPVLEALAAGCRVVTSRGTATEEVAAGRARLVDPHDAEEIFAVTREALAGPRPAPWSGVRRARDTAAEYRDLYRGMAKRGGDS